MCHRSVVLLGHVAAADPGLFPCVQRGDGSTMGPMKAVTEPAGLADLRSRRLVECRLTPDRALGSLDDAEAFLLDRGMLTRTTDSALPSLYEACHEEPYRPGTPGFGTWPLTKWPWFGQLASRGYLVTAVHRGKNMIVSGEVARLLDPICRAEIARMRAADDGWRRLLDHLAATGPASVEDLPAELGLKRQEVKALRSPLERCGAIVSRSLQMTGGADDPHASELARWDQVYPGGAAAEGPGQSNTAAEGPGQSNTAADPRAAFAELVVAGVRAAVVAPERELRRWFSWQWYWTDSLVDDLVREGRLRRTGDHVAAADR